MPEYATSIDIQASPENVFDFLVTAEGLTAWMGQHATLDPREGGVFEVDIAGSPVRGRYLEVDRPWRVIVSWGFAGSAELPPGASRVSLTLSRIDSGTRVDLLHSDLPEVDVAGHEHGWRHFLPRLALVSRGGYAPDDGWRPLGRQSD